MKNYVQKGERMVAIAPSGGVTSGDLIIVGAVAGVAETSALEGEEVVIVCDGVFSLKKAAVAVAQGAKLYWVSADKNVTTTASGNTLIGRAWSAAAEDAAVADVKLTTAN